MKETLPTEQKAPRAFLVGIQDNKTTKKEAESLGRELFDLCGTLGLEIAGREAVHIRENHAQYGLGTGKAAEISEKAAAAAADCLVFDREISPSQQRNWEELTGISVIDRQELIIQIFSGRARTREADLQVSLAELYYSLPRLQHKYIDLNRQKGGRYGNKGSGETRLETDRRLVEQRIHRLEEELETVRRQRDTQRKQRQKQGMQICAVVGYTNAGKSTLLNALTGAEVLAEDKLFATLDSTSRRLILPGGLPILLVDTVGFIRRLPHNLVNAFRSTLEEASLSDLLIHVLDASDPDAPAYHDTTLKVLHELGAEKVPMITVLNKADRPEAALYIEDLKTRYEDAIPLSAGTGAGFPDLLARMESLLAGAAKSFRFPQARSDLAAMLHRSGTVLSEKYEGEFIEMEARVDERIAGKLREFVV